MAKENAKIENVKEVVNNDEQNVKFVNENIHVVPKIMMGRFMKLSIDEQVERINHYIARKEQIKQSIEKNKLINRVKDLFEKKQATVEDAKEVITFCESFINSFKQREIEKIDEEIRKLQTMKQNLED